MKISLPVPPSVNSLYRNVPGRGRCPTGGYQRWVESAAKRFWGVKVTPFSVPVKIKLTLPFGRGPDCDNCIKAVQDLLVKMRVIEDDNRKHVWGVSSELGDVDECLVEVYPA